MEGIRPTQQETPTTPPDWPEGVSLPTYEEAQEAVRKVGEMLQAAKDAELQELRARNLPIDWETVTI